MLLVQTWEKMALSKDISQVTKMAFKAKCTLQAIMMLDGEHINVDYHNKGTKYVFYV